MDRISAANATVDHKFQDGDAGTGQRATSFNAAWANDVQEELVTIIEAAGLTPESGAQQLYKAMVNLQYRVGDYLHTESEVTPATRWPWQTWTEVTGRVLVGYDAAQTEFNAIAKQGGAKSVTLTKAQLPSNAVASFDLNTSGISHDGSVEADQTVLNVQMGGGQALPTLPPYRVVHVWRRTA